MVELAGSGQAPLGVQLRAIFQLRWRIFANGLRRRGGKAELAGRLLLFPVLASLAIGPAVAAAVGAWYLIHNDQTSLLSLLFWAAFGLAQLVNINLGTPGTAFDPAELSRFPLSVARYTLVRLCFGLLSPGNLVVGLMSAAIFAGIVTADLSLWPLALLATSTFTLANVLFTRMVFAWVDRWLSTRRAREVFTACIFAGSLFLQYLNLNHNPALRRDGSRHVPGSTAVHVLHTFGHITPWLRWLPPELSAAAVQAGMRHATAASVLDSAAVLLYAAGFLAIFALRMRTEYRGENLSDAANGVRRAQAAPRPQPAGAMARRETLASRNRRRSLLPASLGPLLAKEILLLRRNVGLLYGVVAPVVMVFLFAGRLSLRGGSQTVLFLAIGYAMLGTAPLSFNSLGLDGAGAQFYFMAPIPLSEVFLAKNLMNLLLAASEIGAVLVIVSLVATVPRPADIAFVILWALGALLLGATVGNLRSISAPKRVLPGRSMQRSQSQLSVWLSFGILLGCAALGAGFQVAAWYLHRPWMALVLVGSFTTAAVLVYVRGLQGIGNYFLAHREALLEELGRKT